MKKITLLATLIAANLLSFAQEKGKPVIVFNEKNYDFGTVKEEIGKVTHDFVFTNKGDAPLMIQQVTASCGCTTPVWTKEPIAPGAKGTISVTYSAAGRPGPFTKTITVNNNSTENPVMLTIKGAVTPKSISLEQVYPLVFGPIHLKTSTVAIGNVIKGETKTARFMVLNTTSAPVALSVGNLPKHITATVQPASIQPNSEATIVFTYNTNLVNDWSVRIDPATLIVNNDAAGSKAYVLNVTANISENFSKLTPEERKNAPMVEIITKEVKLGKVKLNGKTSGTIALKNTGASPLMIRRIFSDCNCITFNIGKNGIAAGKTENIKFSVAVGDLVGQKLQTVNIITNSPSTPNSQLRIGWENVQ